MSKKDELFDNTPENENTEGLEISETDVSNAELEVFDDETDEAIEELIKEKRQGKGGRKERADKKDKKPKKLRNKNAAKQRTYVIITTIIVAGVLVLVNVLSTVIAQRLPTTIDATADNSNTLSDKNITFIQSIDNEVDIIVCASKEGYTGSEMVNYAYNNYYVQENNTPYNYFNQTVTLIENYHKYNSKINIDFVDTQSPDFDKLESESDIEISYGDILVRCTRNIDGKETTLSDIVTFTDIYVLEDVSGGYYYSSSSYYTISASNLESALSGAIYTVASSEQRNVALLSGLSRSGAADDFTEALSSYNFVITEINGLLTSTPLDDFDMLLLVAPTSDLTGEELKYIDKFLQNDGNLGKSFVVFGSTSSPATPNLDDFMEEWGIGVIDGVSYETDDSQRNDYGIMLYSAGDDLTKSVNGSEAAYFCGNNIALSQIYETSGSRTSHILMTTSDTAVVAPKGTSSGGYTPSSSDKKQEIPVIMVTEETEYDENVNEITSYVGYFASEDFISADWDYYGLGNMEFAVNVSNSVSGRANTVYFDYKITRITYMSVTDSQISAVRIVSLYIFPLVVLIGGILIWILRRNR